MKRHALRYSIFTICYLLLCLLVTACSFGPATTTKTSKAAIIAQDGCITAGTPLITYNASDYSLHYPNGWKGQRSMEGSGKGSSFSNTDCGASLMINFASSGGGGISPAKWQMEGLTSITDDETSFKNFQAVNIPKTVVVGGVVWEQRASTGDITRKGKVINVKEVDLVIGYPVNSNSSTFSSAFYIIYQAPTDLFEGINADAFQPMLQSFKFTKK